MVVSRAGRLEGKVAIVTGAGSTPGPGIGTGKATAVVLAREGASVLLVDRDAKSFIAISAPTDLTT